MNITNLNKYNQTDYYSFPLGYVHAVVNFLSQVISISTLFQLY